MDGGIDALPLPRIVACFACRGEELAHVEARDVGLRVAGAEYSAGGAGVC